MSPITRAFSIVIVLSVAAFVLSGCGGSSSNDQATLNPDSGRHPSGWSDPFSIGANNFHATSVKTFQTSSQGASLFLLRCAVCHGDNGAGKIGPPIVGAPVSFITSAINVVPIMKGQAGLSASDIQAIADYLAALASGTPPVPAQANTTDCLQCHGADLDGGISRISCFSCHNGPEGAIGHPGSWSLGKQDPVHYHGSYGEKFVSSCTTCHGVNLTGAIGPSCFVCHDGTIAPILDFLPPPPPPPPVSGVTLVTTLNGAQEVPPVVTAGTGTGTLTVNLTTREISGTVTFSGLTSNAVAAHIHQGAPGVNGPVIVPLAGGSGGTSGTWTIPAGTILTQDQFNALQANNLYFNIHTTTNPNGEIRGQIRFTGITTTTILAGAQEVPPVATQGTGTATLTVDISTGQVINGVLVFSGLTSNAVAAHIHQGAAGVNGPVIIPLEGGAGATSGVWRVPAGTVLTPGQLNAFRANQLYFNIHTTINPGGEIRGQVIFPGGVEITTPLSGVQEVPPVTTSGSGIAAFTVNVDTREISGDLTFTGLTSNAVAAHIHQGVAGANGPVIIPLEGGAGATSGVWKIPAGTILTPDQLNALRANQLYFNIHTTINPGGEMRGQVIFPVGVTTVVPLTGAQEVPAVATPGTGTGMLIVNPDTREASGTVAFSGLTANAVAAHFHLGAAGVNGPVIINLEGGAGATSGVWRVPAGTVLTPDQLNALRANQLYFNIHTTANPGGEIRGQIIFGQIAFPAGTVITTVLNGLQEVPPVSTPGTATGALAVNLDTRVISGMVSFRNLTANAVAGHFHLGAAGTNGPVIIPLEGGAGAASGVWRVPAGTILTPDQLNALRANQLYLNIHTTTNPGGEIRGQVIFSSSTQSSSLARRSVR